MARQFVTLAAVALLALAPLAGQTVSTEILGLVTDQSGAAIPGATVTARRAATGDVRTTTTNDTGNYIFPLLDIGEYEVTCTSSGFKTEVRRGIVLQLQQKARINFQLQVGDQIERVEVQSTAPLLRTEDATLGSVVDERRIVELPLNGRNFGQLATLMPGVTFGVTRMGQDGQQTMAQRAMPGQMIGLSANGQRDLNQNITLDGVTAVDDFKAAMMFSPSIEAIQEFKVQSAVYSAEYGMNSGSQANVAIKSGTNEIHGSVFHFLRNNAFDARGYFLQPDAPQNKLRRNQMGGVVSGPVIKDRTFWLANYEGRRERRGSPSQIAVPTLAMRNGDFSEIIQPGNRYYRTDANPAVSRAIRYPGSTAPFPGNIIPASLIHPVARNLLTWTDTSPFAEGGFLPFPNIDDRARQIGSAVNLAGTNDQKLDSDQILGKVDHRFGDNDRMFARYVIVESAWDNDPLARVNRAVNDYRAQNLGVGYTKILSPTMLNELRFGFNRMRANSLALQTDTGFTHRDLGLDMRVIADGNRTLTPGEEGIPTIPIVGFTGLGSANASLNNNTVYELTDNVTINRGRHNFKFGGLYRYSPVDNFASNLPRGRLNFTRDIVGIPDAFAAFMLGFPNDTNSAEGRPPQLMRQQKMGFYILDDFKATSRLTINIGLRYELFGAVTERDGKARNLSFEDRHIQNINGFTAPMLVPDPETREALYDINKKQFMPRLGIAYRMTDTMVLRMGSGLFFSPQQMNNFNILGLNPPGSGSTVFQNDRNNPQATFDNPFAGVTPGAGPAAIIMLGRLKEDRGNRSNYLNNYIWQWTTEIEKSFGRDLVAGVAYVGSAASHIDWNVANSNNPDPGLGAVQGRRPVPFYVDSRDPSTLLALGTVRRMESSVSSNYNALQGRLEKRYSAGLTFNAAFNYQRAMSVGYGINESAGFGPNAPQNPRDRRSEYGRSNIDQRLRFVFSHVYEIPFMRNQPGPAGWILGGWSVNGIVQLTSGLPVTVTQQGDAHNTGAGSAQRPHIAPGASLDRVWSDRSPNQWFPTDAFIRSKCDGCAGAGIFLGPLGYGNAGPGLFDAPALKTWDFALFKDFRVREGHRLQFRWEAFNFTNSPQFNGPSRALGAADFGRITSTVINNREMQFALKYMF
ncbi:MAG: TonB-dependent receptor [Bryobacterales bacterium]|nr:TonB-dependent receptor [Bryobacterales bacterium]